MKDYPLTLHAFPRAILHIDGDAFFASCEQSKNPALKGRPVITGKERGIVASMSYEAKSKGVARGMRLFEVGKLCPDAAILPSDYETYSLLSKRFFNIVKRYTPDVEEYSIDECFADITGLRRPLRLSYEGIAGKIKDTLKAELGFTFSIGLAPNKVLAKVASKWNKPSGLTIIAGSQIHHFLNQTPVEKIWGIGPQTCAFLNKKGTFTALEFARKPEEWVRRFLTKPFYEIWQELNGKYILGLETSPKDGYASIQKMKTFSPPSSDRGFVFAQISKNIENACIKARRHHLAAREAVFFLRTQDFNDAGIEARFSRATNFPHEIVAALESHFHELFDPAVLYRSTGVILAKLEEDCMTQLILFESALKVEEFRRLYHALDEVNAGYGKHTVHLGTSFDANKFSQHLGKRGDLPQRKTELFKGETARRRLNIPVLNERHD